MPTSKHEFTYINKQLLNAVDFTENTAAWLKTSVDECMFNTPSVALLTRHVDHPAVAILHNVARLAVDPAGGYAVDLKEARLQSFGLALSPRGRQVSQLERRKHTEGESYSQ